MFIEQTFLVRVILFLMVPDTFLEVWDTAGAMQLPFPREHRQ